MPEVHNYFIHDLLDSLPLAVFCKDYSTAPGVFVYWNKSSEEVFGFERSSIIGKTDFDLFAKEEAEFFMQKDLETIESGKTIFIESEPISRANDVLRILRTWKVPLVSNNKKYLLGITQDITEQKDLEKKLEDEQQRRLQDAKLISLGEMAGGIAHEINNPLAVINGYINNLSKMSGKKLLEPQKMDVILDKMSDTVQRITKITTSLRILSRDESQVECKSENLLTIVQETMDVCSNRFKSNNIELFVDISPEVKVQCMHVSLGQVFINLLNNAHDALSELDQREKWVKIFLKNTKNGVKIIIEDSGKGIEKKIVEKLFDPFFTTKEVGKGTGIGLSLSKSLIEKQGGRLYYNPESENTQFIIELKK